MEQQLLQPTPEHRQQTELPTGKSRLSKREIGLIAFIVVAIVGVAVYAIWMGKDKASSISSFAECVAAGNPVMESYPEQCAANGKTWTNPEQQSQPIPYNDGIE